MKKQCSKCKQLLSIKEFGKRRNSRDGLEFWCKSCIAVYNIAYRTAHKEESTARHSAYYATHKKEAAAYRATHKEKAAAYQINYRKTHKMKINARISNWRRTPQGRAAEIRHRIKNPLKIQCHSQLNRALITGAVERQSCINGCSDKAHGHHLNYQRPLVVIWLCRGCHVVWHRKPLNKYFLNRMNKPKINGDVFTPPKGEQS